MLSHRPPRLARAWLERALPDDVREDVSGDLEEMFHRRLERDGIGRARLWYWRQAASFFVHFFAERLRQPARQADMSTGFSWIDFRLALRMLIRYPGLTFVSVMGMAVGIAIATAAFTVAFSLLNPVVPLDEGDRVVSLVTWDAATNNREHRLMHDYSAWRQLASVEDIGAYRNVNRNLIAPGSQPEAVSLAEISAAGFRVARVPALVGRHLLPDDERAGAPDVVVIAHDVWQRRFLADPGVLGRSIQIGATTHTIVGVMPEGFAFPVSHSYWVPWRADPSAYEPRTGPAVHVFARLRSGATLESAQAELTAISQRLAAASPVTHEHLRPRVVPYTYAYSDMSDPEMVLALHATQTVIVLLLVLVCVNVAILVYARTATRQGEIAVRSALGASRRRIVAQLFVEALVLAAVAAIIGLGLASTASTHIDVAVLQLAGRLPFWMAFRLSTEGILYLLALTMLAAAIVGILPALKATGRQVHTRLQTLSAGSGSRMQMGRLWTVLIIAQVAVTVAVLPATMFHAWNALRLQSGDRGVAAREYLTTPLLMDRSAEGPSTATGEREFRTRYGRRQAELERRLEAEAAVRQVTFSMTNPGEELALILEVEGMPAPADPVNYNIVEGSTQGHLVRFNRIAVDFFDVFDLRMVMGRSFHAGDAAPSPVSVSGSNLDPATAGPTARDASQGAASQPVIVNRALVDGLFRGENTLGRRIRYVGRSREAAAEDVELNRWYEIVGVVQDRPGADGAGAERVKRLYHAALPGDVHPTILTVRVRGTEPTAFANRLREVSAAVDPSLQLKNVSSIEEALNREQGLMRLIGVTLTTVTVSTIVLSAAGIYALMSFTVARRRREIGIRAALGADPSRILASIFSRAFGQLAIGATIGMLGAIGLEQALEGEMFEGQGAVMLPIVAVTMTVVGLLAALGPACRGLRIQPTEALREE